MNTENATSNATENAIKFEKFCNDSDAVLGMFIAQLKANLVKNDIAPSADNILRGFVKLLEPHNEVNRIETSKNHIRATLRPVIFAHDPELEKKRAEKEAKAIDKAVEALPAMPKFKEPQDKKIVDQACKDAQIRVVTDKTGVQKVVGWDPNAREAAMRLQRKFDKMQADIDAAKKPKKRQTPEEKIAAENNLIKALLEKRGLNVDLSILNVKPEPKADPTVVQNKASVEQPATIVKKPIANQTKPKAASPSKKFSFKF